jgi:hypothetical protein
MKNHKEILEELKKIVKEEIKECKKYKRELFKEMQTSRAHKYNQIPGLLDSDKRNSRNKERYEQVLSILNSIEY